jgi:hypothetical protein
MGDPVSWFLISSGWRVVSSDGQEVGRVDEVAGDQSHDIFDGLAIATSALGKPRYVPSEQVGMIEEGIVHLTISSAESEQLSEYLEPATNIQIEPDDRRGLGETVGAELRGLESRFLEPPEKRAHSMNVWRRLWFALRRLVQRN